MTIDHSAYNPNPVGLYKTYCPGCLRVVRCGNNHEGEWFFYRHWLDPQVPKGERDRCVNSRVLVAEAEFITDDGRIVSRATYELARGPR